MIVGSENMIERVSRALLRSDYTRNGIVSPMLDAIEDSDWRLYACNARAALQALMEPSHAMIKAMAQSQAKDDEGFLPLMCDLLDFSGENKRHTVLKQAWSDAISSAMEGE